MADVCMGGLCCRRQSRLPLFAARGQTLTGARLAPGTNGISHLGPESEASQTGLPPTHPIQVDPKPSTAPQLPRLVLLTSQPSVALRATPQATPRATLRHTPPWAPATQLQGAVSAPLVHLSSRRSAQTS